MSNRERPQSHEADRVKSVLITEAQIRDKIRELGDRIDHDYKGRPLTIVAVLTGSLIFLADVIRQIRTSHRIALMQASSYRGDATTPDALIVNATLDPDVSDRDVLLVDDILDTGRTLSALVKHLRGRGARSVRTAVLLRKRDRQEVPIEPDYSGFEIPNAFVVGYGLDYNDDYRHLPYIGVLCE